MTHRAIDNTFNHARGFKNIHKQVMPDFEDS